MSSFFVGLEAEWCVGKRLHDTGEVPYGILIYAIRSEHRVINCYQTTIFYHQVIDSGRRASVPIKYYSLRPTMSTPPRGPQDSF